MAREMLEKDDYGGVGQTIRFHPNTTYENPIEWCRTVKRRTPAMMVRWGFASLPEPGFLMEAAACGSR